MSKSQNKRVLAGCAILVGIITITVLVFFLEIVRAALADTYHIVIVMPSAAGLKNGTPVWLAGKEVGKIATIGFRPVEDDSTPSIAVNVELPSEVEELIRTDSRVRITTARAVGEPLIDIAPGSPSLPQIEDGDTLYAVPRPSMVEAMSNIKTLRMTLDSLMKDARVLMPRAAARQREFAHVARRLEAAQAEMRALTSNVSSGSMQVLTDPRLRASFAELAATTRKLAPAFQEAAQRYSGPEVKQAFTRLQTHAAAISAQIDSLTSILANGSLTRFAQDSAIIKALHGAQLEMDSLMAVTKRNPLRFWFGDGDSASVRKRLGEPLRRED